jgi:NTP pyrophosphatase (non-canonical NTP hydrolase)
MTTIKELQARAYRQSADKGFHDDEPAYGAPGWVEYDAMKLALMHSEVSEALEELRSGRAPYTTYYPVPKPPNSLVAEVGVAKAEELIARDNEGKPRKPEGVPSELADVVIRILDYAETRGIDLERIIVEKLDYNATRASMHGGKKF